MYLPHQKFPTDNLSGKPQLPSLQSGTIASSPACGEGFTTISSEAAGEVQPLTVTVRLYVPAAAGEILPTTGACSTEAKPLGPVQS
jgi:hypothetical protein